MPHQKTVFLHVGCRKSGTSGIQLGLKRAAEDLRATGLEQPLGGRGGTMGGLVDPLRRSLGGGDDRAARKAVAALATAIAESPFPRHLITLEALAELPPEATSIVVSGLSAFDTHVVVTVRPWVFTIPSEWQQLVKSRFTTDYLDYANALHHPEDASPELAEEAARFRRRQDAADVVRRWRAADPDLAAHVVLVPPSRHARPDLTELYCTVVGIDPAAIPVVDRVVNPSITHENAELLRMVNLALGERLADTQGDYRHSVRKWIAVGSMMKGSPGSRIRLPRDLQPWATAEAARQVKELDELGCEVIGDSEGFINPPLPDEDFAPATDAQVAQAAAAVIADLAQAHALERERERERERRKVPVAAHTHVVAPTPARGLVSRARALAPQHVLGRLRRRTTS